MYERYGTEAIVLGSKAQREADRTLWLLTRDFGLVFARGISLRVEKSKLRYAVGDLAHVHVELVRGREVWRLAGAQPKGLFWQGTTAGLTGFARLARLVQRLVAGEEPHEGLFDMVVDARYAFEHPEHDPVVTELLAVARLLQLLGYVAPDGAHASLFEHGEWGDLLYEKAQAERSWLRATINHALNQAQL